MKEDAYFEMLSVVRQLSETEVAVYRCLRKLPAGGYVVRNVDQIRVPVDRKMLRDQEAIFWENLIEMWPEDTSRLYDTVEAAIEAFHASFPSA